MMVFVGSGGRNSTRPVISKGNPVGMDESSSSNPCMVCEGEDCSDSQSGMSGYT